MTHLTIKVTPQEKELIKKKAKEENRNMSSYIRNIFKEKIKKEKRGVNNDSNR